MSFSNKWAIVLKQDSGLAAEKQWKCEVSRTPNQIPTSATVGSDTTGPLSTTGIVDALINHGDGTNTGFATPIDALQRAISYVLDDRSLNG